MNFQSSINWIANFGVVMLLLLGATGRAQTPSPESQRAYKAYQKQQKAIDRRREQSIDAYKASKLKKQKSKEESRQNFKRKAKRDRSKPYERYLKKTKKKEAKKLMRQESYANEQAKKDDNGRLAYGDINGVVVKDRDRVPHDKRTLYTEKRGSRSAVANRPSPASPNEGRNRRFDTAREQRNDFSDEPPPPDDRFAGEENLPPPVFEEPPMEEPRYDESFGSPDDMSDDFPPPPPPEDY